MAQRHAGSGSAKEIQGQKSNALYVGNLSVLPPDGPQEENKTSTRRQNAFIGLSKAPMQHGNAGQQCTGIVHSGDS